MMMGDAVIFHIDVNSAFLSWTAAHRVHVLGDSFDLRNVPSVIGGDQESRKGIVLAKSIPAKKYGIQTGEPLRIALEKCPSLVVAQADFELYRSASSSFIRLLRTFTPVIEQYSIDEAWADMTGTERLYGSAYHAAELIAERIREDLGFTVNIGISSNKLLAKMASDFEKPDKIHTLFPAEIPEKLWPLPVESLFLVGKRTAVQLRSIGIGTIRDLACADPAFLCRRFGKFGSTLWNYANGIASGELQTTPQEQKSYGNSVTTPVDLTEWDEICRTALSLCETIGERLRKDGKKGSCITVHIRTNLFRNFTHQCRLKHVTNVTEELYRLACLLLAQLWDHITPIRLIGVQVSQLSDGEGRQLCLFEDDCGRRYERLEITDHAVDEIRSKYGTAAIQRARFVGRGN